MLNYFHFSTFLAIFHSSKFAHIRTKSTLSQIKQRVTKNTQNKFDQAILLEDNPVFYCVCENQQCGNYKVLSFQDVCHLSNTTLKSSLDEAISSIKSTLPSYAIIISDKSSLTANISDLETTTISILFTSKVKKPILTLSGGNGFSTSALSGHQSIGHSIGSYGYFSLFSAAVRSIRLFTETSLTATDVKCTFKFNYGNIIGTIFSDSADKTIKVPASYHLLFDAQNPELKLEVSLAGNLITNCTGYSTSPLITYKGNLKNGNDFLGIIKKSSGLSALVIILIVVGCVILLVIFALLIRRHLRKQRRHRKRLQKNNDEDPDDKIVQA